MIKKEYGEIEKVWVCPKCDASSPVVDKKDIGRSREPFSSSHTKEIVSMTSGGISKLFNIQNQKFIVITCRKCAFSEFYRTDVKAWENIIDFFGN